MPPPTAIPAIAPAPRPPPGFEAETFAVLSASPVAGTPVEEVCVLLAVVVLAPHPPPEPPHAKLGIAVAEEDTETPASLQYFVKPDLSSAAHNYLVLRHDIIYNNRHS